jgi:serine/threonine protein kinase
VARQVKLEMVTEPTNTSHDIASSSTSDNAPGKVGKYRVDAIIGRGAVGIVYKGYDPQIERPVALKTLRNDVLDAVADRKGLLLRFGREARSAGRCQHPNIVTVYDYVEHSEAPYIVMEYVEAGTLDHVTRSGTKLPLRQVGEVMTQLLAALQHAHTKGVIHRDVKPANILCPAATSIKVTDFGVARFDDLSVTSTGGAGALGTPNYMSPEQFLGRPVDARADLFSAGVILFQLLTGTKPFIAGDLPDLMRKLLNQAAPAVSQIRPELWQLDRAVHRALARNPVDRYQTADEFIVMLGEAIGKVDTDVVPPLDLTAFSRQRSDEKTDTSGELSKTMAQRLSPETLHAVGSGLARSIGPIARVFVKRAAREAIDADKFLSSLCSQIPTEMEATTFRKEAERWLRDDQGIAAVQLDAVISDLEIKRATAALLPLIGPLARVLAERHATTAIGRDDYYEHLAKAIKDPADRDKFIDANVSSRSTPRRPS